MKINLISYGYVLDNFVVYRKPRINPMGYGEHNTFLDYLKEKYETISKNDDPYLVLTKTELELEYDDFVERFGDRIWIYERDWKPEPEHMEQTEWNCKHINETRIKRTIRKYLD